MELSKRDVGKNVKKARDQKSLAIGSRYTQKMLEFDTGISQGYISDIESGRSYPSRDAAVQIAKACGVSLDFILGMDKDTGIMPKPLALAQLKESFSQILDITYLPVIGNIAAGTPILAEENIETYLPYPSQDYDAKTHFVLRVQGESMQDADINNGDLVVIRKQSVAENGQIVAVRLRDNGVTLKKFYFEQDRVLLKPCNDAFQPIELNENIEIIGIAVSVTKKLA